MNPQLADVLARTRTLLLDFDGPICSIFAGYPAAVVAAELRDILIAHDRRVAALVTELDDAHDPLRILRLAGDLGDEHLTRTIADALRDAEVKAALTAEPTPGLDRVIEAAKATGRTLAVVSNNSWQAVIAYSERFGLLEHFQAAIGRYDGMAPQLMKPHNHLIRHAIDGAGADALSTTLVGDTPTDIQAARASSVMTIGYANQPGKAELLRDAGADAVVATMDDLADALLAGPAPG